ncbi:MAG: flagella basal body P-ring formation protein FlgA [Halobacteriovoraceae bacterium]|nr:flagella basal body P-ring formation protein FlgA [Halobacteriovoraceae bacterium]|tara:strand:+ start:17143 stop:18006 length:864 start_codon:yes stop_codon:yes gene_type:complete
MIFKFALSLILLSSTTFAKDCTMQTSARVYKINKILDSSFIKSTNCSTEAKNHFVRFVSSASGKLNPKHLSHLFSTEYGQSIQFANPIEVVDARDFVAEKLKNKDLVIESLSSLYGKASINLEESDRLSIECAKCEKPGNKNIKLKINGKTFWLNAKIKIKRKGYRLKTDVAAFSDNLDSTIVEQTYGIDSGKVALFSDVNNLKFYRTRRPISKGSLLKQSDLILKNLVRYNNKVEVHIKSDSLSLKTKALARENGKLGQLVKLFNPKTKKVLTGKVIDYNKVLVEL